MAGARRGADDDRARGLWVGVLGPVLVRRDGAEIPPGTPGQRAVLALAALDALARRESVIDALWEENPPVTAVAIVQTYVSRLRALLGAAEDGGRILARAGSGYRLCVADDAVDLRVFRRLADEARHAREAGDAPGACDAYERALGLWRGEPAEDVEALRTHPAVTALTAERTAVTREFADLASALGWDGKALPHLRGLAARDPLDEASQARLMGALAGCGRQAEALQLYEDVRRRLDDQLAVTPGPELRAAHARVLRQEVPSAADEWRPVFQLPAAVADFTGRAADIGKLAAALLPGDGQPGVPVVVVCGQPGVGKTSLALHVAHTLRERFPGGQLWVHLAGASARPRDPGDVLGEFLRALGVPGPAIPEDGQERAACYRSRLAGRRVLVVTDDAASAAQVRPLLPGTAGCAVLVTSRSQLDALAGAALLPLGVMTPQDAARLLTRMAGSDRVAAEPAAVGALIDACGALPLALRIAGGKLAARPVWPVSAVLRRITQEHSRLQELEAGDLSVRASIASSYQALPDRASRLFRRLSLLGPADFAEWVPGVLLGEPDAVRVTDELVGKSLLTPVAADSLAEPRYRLHDLLRDYAGERLNDETAASQEAAMDRMLEALLQLARLAVGRLPAESRYLPFWDGQPRDQLPAEVAAEITADPVAWFTAERNSLRAAIEHASTARRWKLAAQLAGCLASCRYVLDPGDVEQLWQRIAEAARRGGDQTGAAQASLRSAAGTIGRGYSADAVPLLDDCIQRFQDAGHREDLVIAVYWRAGCALDLGDYEIASRTAEQGRAVAREVGDRRAELRYTQILGYSLTRSGQHEAGIAECEQAVSMARELGFSDGPALHALANACCVAGQRQRALSLSAELFESASRFNDPLANGGALMVRAEVYHEAGRFQDALDALIQAERVFRAGHAGRPLANCLLKQGQAHQAMGSAEAIPRLEQCLRIFRELRLPRRIEEAQEALDRCRELTEVT